MSSPATESDSPEVVEDDLLAFLILDRAYKLAGIGVQHRLYSI